MNGYAWDIGNVTLEVRRGDLLSARVGAVVNSEQSDFVLSSDVRTISGQLRRACPSMQQELDEQTHQKTLPAGTVLQTAGPRSRYRVFHAGFHDPHEWLDPAETDDVARHAATIRRCVDDILRRVRASEILSVAFPSIGTGAFRLPRATFARLFFDCVGAVGMTPGRAFRVVLCLRDDDAVALAVREGTRALVALLGGGGPLLAEAGGHSLVEALRPQVRLSSDPFTAAGRLLHFAEVALHIDLAVAWEFADAPLARLTTDLAGGRAQRLTFGFIRNRLEGGFSVDGAPDWLRRRVEFLRGAEARQSIAALVDDRNAYAHHRRPRDLGAMRADVERLFGPAALPARWPAPPPRDRWLHGDGPQTWLLDSVDLDRRMTGWVQPVTRDVNERQLAGT